MMALEILVVLDKAIEALLNLAVSPNRQSPL